MKMVGMICGGIATIVAILLAGTGRRPANSQDRTVRIVAVAPAAGLVAPDLGRAAPSRHAVTAPPAGASLKSGIGARDDARAMLGALAAQVRTEERDRAWADRSEAQLRMQLARIVPYGAAPASVGCRKTLCEIAGSLPASFGAGQVSALLQALQTAEMRAALPDSSIVGGPAMTVRSKDGDRYTMFFKREL